MYNFGTFGVTVMNSAHRGGALINCDVSFVCVCVCVCVCVFYSYVRIRPFCKNLCLQRSLFEPILQKLMFTSFGCVEHFAKTFVDVLRLSPFCKNLCSSSSTEPILQKPMSTFFD